MRCATYATQGLILGSRQSRLVQTRSSSQTRSWISSHGQLQFSGMYTSFRVWHLITLPEVYCTLCKYRSALAETDTKRSLVCLVGQLRVVLTTTLVLAYPKTQEHALFVWNRCRHWRCFVTISGWPRACPHASRTFTKLERRYSTTRKEFLALVYLMRYFRLYLIGSAFQVRTDRSIQMDPNVQTARRRVGTLAWNLHLRIWVRSPLQK